MTELVMNTSYWADAIHNAVEAGAIIVGGGWAWWKFIRGRTFNRRSDLELEADVLPQTRVPVIRVRATWKNTGSANIPLRLAVASVAASTADGWSEIGKTEIFADHKWIESDEEISDEVVLPLCDVMRETPLRVRCDVYSTKFRLLPHRERDGTWHFKQSRAWTRNVVLPFPHDPPKGDHRGQPLSTERR